MREDLLGRNGAAESFDIECEDLGRRCAAARMRLDVRAPARFQHAYRKFAGERRVPAYFERKWLSLRLSAVKRGMVVSEAVTPSFLEKIFCGHCPVTLEPLEFQERSNRNPSVDRLVNELGYVPGNICMLSLRANRAKGCKSFEDVAAIAQAGEAVGGMAAIEWMRLTSLMYGAWARAYKRADPWLMPLASVPGRGMFMSTSQAVQLFLMSGVGPDGLLDNADGKWSSLTQGDGCSGSLYRQMQGLLSEAMKRNDDPCMAWLDEDVFTAFERWYIRSRPVVTAAVESVLMERQSRKPGPDSIAEWEPQPRHIIHVAFATSG